MKCFEALLKIPQSLGNYSNNECVWKLKSKGDIFSEL